MAPSVLVVDDDATILGVTRLYLERAGYAVDVAGDGVAALEAVRAQRPDLVVLDWLLPRMDGMSVLRGLHGQAPGVPVLMLTARAETQDRVQGLDAGADDYLVKPFQPDELVARVRAILRRCGPAREPGRDVLRAAGLRLEVSRHRATLHGHTVPLTAIEFRLLRALAEFPEHVCTRERLLDSVHGLGEKAVFERVIDAHVAKIRRKLHAVDAQCPLVTTVRGVGYRLLP